MLVRGYLLGSAVAIGTLMLIPGVAAAAARGVRLGLDGLETARTGARQTVEAAARSATAGGIPSPLPGPDAFLRFLAEALEAFEDLGAEVRADLLHGAAAPDGRTGVEADAAEIVVLGGGQGSAAAPLVRVAHRAGGRLRLSLEGALPEPVLHDLADQLAAFDGVERVLARLRTGSLVIEASEPVADLAERLAAAGLIRLDGFEPAPRPGGMAVRQALGGLDLLLRLRTRGAGDLRQAVAVALVAEAALRRDPQARAMAERLAARLAARSR